MTNKEEIQLKEEASLSEFQLAMRGFAKNKLAMLCVWVLGLLYLSAIFADFLSPYSYKTENRALSYAPPSAIHLMHEGESIRSVVNF